MDIAHFKITKKKLNEQCVIGMPDTADWILKCQFDRRKKSSEDFHVKDTQKVLFLDNRDACSLSVNSDNMVHCLRSVLISSL